MTMDRRAILQSILSGKLKPSEIPGSGVLTVSVAGNDLYNVNGVVVDLIELKRLQYHETCRWANSYCSANPVIRDTPVERQVYTSQQTEVQ